MTSNGVNIIIFLIGLTIAVLSHPKLLTPIMQRLFNEGIVSPRRFTREETEIIRFAGPNLSLFAVGVVLMLLGIMSKTA